MARKPSPLLHKKPAIKPQNSTNSGEIPQVIPQNSADVEFLPRVETPQTKVEFSTVGDEGVVEFDLGKSAAIQQARLDAAKATARAKKFAAYAAMGEEELAQLAPADLQAYKSSENKKKSEYQKRNSPMLHTVKMRLAVIDRAQARQEGKI